MKKTLYFGKILSRPHITKPGFVERQLIIDDKCVEKIELIFDIDNIDIKKIKNNIKYKKYTELQEKYKLNFTRKQYEKAIEEVAQIAIWMYSFYSTF